MAFEIEWLESAREDLDAEIAYVFKEFGFVAAKKAFLKIETVTVRLSSFPQMGSVYPNVTYKGNEVRKFPMQQTTLFYSQEADKVIILALWNHNKNLENIPHALNRHS